MVLAKNFEPALALLDLVIDNPTLTKSAYCNALWAVQADNNKLPFDAERARRYLAACEPHAEANPSIYINVACVKLELGDRDGMFAALEAAKRHKLKHELAALRDQQLFAPLRKDPRFRAVAGK